jgi:hypothetical protein
MSTYCSGNQTKEEEMGGACSMCEGEELCLQGVGRETGKRALGRPQCISKVILKWMLMKWNRRAWTGLIWLRRGTNGERL